MPRLTTKLALKYTLMLASATAGMASLGCAHEHHHHNDNEVYVDEHGWRHEGYYDEHHGWHGGYYDEHKEFHSDPPEWHHP